MKPISLSEQKVLLALYACQGPATRRQIQIKLSAQCKWADSTVLNFLGRLEEKGYVTSSKQANRNLYTPTIPKARYLYREASQLLEGLFGGNVTALLETLVEGQAIGLEELEQAKAWVEDQLYQLGDYDLW